MKPWFALFLLAPFFGEVASSSSAPITLIDPSRVLFMALLYGSGAILIREYKVRFNKPWQSVFLLGAAYGILEEGLCCKSFFDPHWPGLKAMENYGRYYEVNWVWTFFLTIFHAFISIGLPIVIAELIFKERRHEPWVKVPGIVGLSIALIFVTALGYAYFPDGIHPYYPEPIMVVACLVAMGGLGVIAHLYPTKSDPNNQSRVSKGRGTGWLGFLCTFVFFAGMFVFPETVIHPLSAIGFCFIAFTLLGFALVAYSRSGTWTDLDIARFVGGVLIALAVLALIVDLGTGFVQGMALAAAFEIGLVFYLKKRAQAPLAA